MGRGSRARPRRRRFHEVDINQPVDLNDKDWWWLEGLPVPDATPPEDVPVEAETPPEDMPAEADDPPEVEHIDVDLEEFLATHTATDDQFITGAGDPSTIWVNLLASMMESISLSVVEDANAN
jgi:hypothetical protein